MKKILVSITLFALLLSCGRRGQDQTHRGNDRIVCVSKQLTELLFALHVGGKIVGVDLSSTYPPETAKLTSVGYHRHLNAEGILSLDPTVVVHQGDVAPPQVMEQLKKVGIPIKVYPAANTLDSTKQLIRLLGKEFNQDTAAARIIAKLNADLSSADSMVGKLPSRPKVLIIHFGQQMNQYFVIGTRGVCNEMVRLAGGINAADTTAFRTLSPEVIVKAQPDVILATEFGYDRLKSSGETFTSLPGVALTPAAKNGRIFRIEEHDLLYFGPRTGENIIRIAKIIHQ